MSVHQLIQLMKREGSNLAEPLAMQGMPPMTFACSFSKQTADRADVDALPHQSPDDLREFWNEAQSARLFEDREYGQWGLEVFRPSQAAFITDQCASKRQQDFIAGDLVIGRFLGDSDLLVIRCDRAARDFGTVIVALPLDPRNDWYQVAASFSDFLETYVKCGGAKFWEEPGKGSEPSQ